MENGNTKYKKIIMLVIVFAIIVGGISFYFISKNKKITFEYNEGAVFTFFTSTHDDPSLYEIKSLDAYYYDDGNMSSDKYFFKLSYRAYYEEDDEWCDYEQLSYGRYMHTDKTIMLNWSEESLKKHQDDIKDYEAAVEKGKHKSYTKEEIEKGIEKYKVED